MERITSKLMRVVAIALLCAAAVTTASSQESTKTVDYEALAAKGEALVNADQDPLVIEFRDHYTPESPYRRGFNIGMAAAAGDTLPGPGKDRICASVPRDESQGCSLGVSFSVDRNRNADLAARGAAIAKLDPLVALSRTSAIGRRKGGIDYQLGFDIGMAAAEGHTLPGPGKQKIHDALGLRAQAGFATAVTFSLDRNRNSKLAEIGAAIAQARPEVAAARINTPDILYWLGFDIASGLFGDPALGALGNTATGPGSLKIRDSLSPAGQVGFNASVTFHLSKNYKR